MAHVQARPGVIELMDEAINHPNVKVGICSASGREGFEKLVDVVVGQERLRKLDFIIAGDDVSKRKPHPMIYDMAREKMNIPHERCLIIEDSGVGLKAAVAANIKCIITYTQSTANEDFCGQGAFAKLPDLGNTKLKDLFPL